MAGNKIKTFSIVEWSVLAIVIFATLSLQPTPKEAVEEELESTKITGTVELSTRSAMNSLGLDDFKLGPLATVDLVSNPVISSNCPDCQFPVSGINVYGEVIITQLIDQDNRQGRVEAILNLTYLREINSQDLIFREWLKNEKIDADMEFYNSDGSASGACGNGTRCVAYLLSKEINKNKIILGTESGNLESKILDEQLVETKIGPAKTNWNEIPLVKKSDTINLNYKIIDNNNKEHFGGTAVNVGNPHVVFFVNNIEDFNLDTIEKLLPLDHSIFDSYWRNSKAGFIETIESCNRNYLFKKYSDENLIGYAILGTTRNFSFLQRFGISKEYQNEGHGSSLLEDVISFAKNKKLVNIRLNTQSSNSAAKKLYLNKGFKLTNTDYIIFSSR